MGDHSCGNCGGETENEPFSLCDNCNEDGNAWAQERDALRAENERLRARVAEEREIASLEALRLGDQRDRARKEVAVLREALEWCVEMDPDLYGYEDPEKGVPLTIVAAALNPEPPTATCRKERLAALGYETPTPEQMDPFVRPSTPKGDLSKLLGAVPDMPFPEPSTPATCTKPIGDQTACPSDAPCSEHGCTSEECSCSGEEPSTPKHCLGWYATGCTCGDDTPKHADDCLLHVQSPTVTPWCTCGATKGKP